MHQGDIPRDLQRAAIGNQGFVWYVEQSRSAVILLPFPEPAVEGLGRRRQVLLFRDGLSTLFGGIIHVRDEGLAGFLTAWFRILIDPFCGGRRRLGSVVHDNIL
jgi:hypothetical protein